MCLHSTCVSMIMTDRQHSTFDCRSRVLRCIQWCGLLNQCNTHVQAAELERARGLAAQLLVRCEQTRMAVMAAAANYRRLFAWLLQCIRRLDEDADTLVRILLPWSCQCSAIPSEIRA